MTRGRWDRKGCALMGRAGKTSQQDGTEVSQKDTKEHSTCRPAVEHSRSGSGCSRSPMEVTAGELTEQERAWGPGEGMALETKEEASSRRAPKGIFKAAASNPKALGSCVSGGFS